MPQGIDRALTVLLAQVDVAAFREHLRSTQGPMPFNDLERLLGTQQCWAALAQLYEHSSLPAKSLEIWFKCVAGRCKHAPNFRLDSLTAT